MSFIDRYIEKIAETRVAPPHKRILHIDYETYSEADLPKVGASVYARHPSTEILMLAYGWSDGEIKQWVPEPGLSQDELIATMPRDLYDALQDPFVTVAAWNAPFEMAITEHVLGMHVPIYRWLDVMALAYSMALPGKLEKCGEVIGLGAEQRKMARGKLLVRRFCGPRKPTKNKPWTRETAETDPVGWQEFLDYNVRDVEAERQIYRRLKPYQMPDHEWALWHLDQKINSAGIPINLNAVRNAIKIAEETVANDLAEMEELTGLDNPNATGQLLEWLRANGYAFLDLKKGHVERAWKQAKQEDEDGTAEILGNHPDLARVLELRLRVSKASVKKYFALILATDEDGNLRGCHQFAGAGRTWRWSGRRFQPQNLPKPAPHLEGKEAELVSDIEWMTAKQIEEKWGNPMEVLTACVRPMVQAGLGRLLVDADLSAIENVVLGWVADEDKILRVFREGLDPYIDFAVDMFRMSYAEIEAEVKSGNKKKRTTAKPGVLGCLRGDTPVLTNRGWVRMVEVRHDDLLWDGVEWVSHRGVAFRGRQEVRDLAGVWATPDHKFLTQFGWRETCQLESQPTMFASALATANGSFSDLPGAPVAPERYSDAAAAAASNAKSPGQTSSGGCLRNAPDALLLTVAPRSERGSARTYSTFSQIASTLLGDAVRIPRIVPTVTTGGGVFVCGSRMPSPGSNTSFSTSGQTEASKSTGSTTTATTKWETCDWQPARSRTQISDTWDVIEAGPRNRFTILTKDGPVISHNCGYMLGKGEPRENKQTGEIEATGLLGYAWNMGVDLTPEMSALSVETFRAKFSKVKSFWYDFEAAVKRVIRTGTPEEISYFRIDMKGPFMRIRLPSGRHLHYMRPKLVKRKMPWGKIKTQVTYQNMENGQWRRVTTHPGKLTENVVQAVARDILAHGMMLADAAGIDIRMHVHDQIVALAPEDRAEAIKDLLIRLMTTLPAWANEKLPLKAAGLTTPIFVKD